MAQKKRYILPIPLLVIFVGCLGLVHYSEVYVNTYTEGAYAGDFEYERLGVGISAS